MPEYLSPGVYIEEFELGPRSIEGVSTSTAGFLGETQRGPLHPRLVTGFEEYKRIYGGFFDPIEKGYLPFAIDGFFRNGGQRCFVARIIHDDAVVTTGDFDPLLIKAVGPGEWGNRVAFKIGPGSLQTATGPRTRIKLTVMYWDQTPPTPLIDPTLAANATDPNRREPVLVEIYDNLSIVPTSIDFIETRINPSSNLIEVTFADDGDVPEDSALEFIGTGGDNGGDIVPNDYDGRVLAGDDNPDETQRKSGLMGFEQIDEISILNAPNHHADPEIASKLITQCTQLKDRFAVLHSNPNTQTLNNVATVRVPQDTTYAAFYFPWIKVLNPLTNRDTIVPPSGHVIGIYANTDTAIGVHKAPANAVVEGARGLQFQITKGEQDLLNPRGVNCLRAFPNRGIRVWGARTCSSNSLWRYINVRRLFLFIEESIEEGTQYLVFEPNNERLWQRVVQTITQFLTTVWRTGALMGLKAEHAFFVKCDRTTMTQDDIDGGRLVCVIGIAPTKPAEFVIFRITQFPGGSDVVELT